MELKFLNFKIIQSIREIGKITFLQIYCIKEREQ